MTPNEMLESLTDVRNKSVKVSFHIVIIKTYTVYSAEDINIFNKEFEVVN